MSIEPTYNFQDLKNWGNPGTHLAVIGHPIDHSLSPLIHNTALQYLAETDPKFLDWHYHKFDIQIEELSKALKLFHKKSFRGLNITAPHKIVAFQLVNQIDETAHPYNAINTLVCINKSYKGYNTDITGLENAIKKSFNLPIKGQNIILLGAGGAAAAAAAHCVLSSCKKLYIGNRSLDKLELLTNRLQALRKNSNIVSFDIKAPTEDLPQDAILINATSLGLQPKDPSPINLSLFGPELKVLDMIYKKTDSTLLVQAKKRGMATCNGLTMLVEQALESFMLWTHHEISDQIMNQAITNYLNL